VIEAAMQIVLNGNQHQLAAEMSLAQLVEELGVDRRLVAVAHNGEVVRRDTYDQVTVRDGDRVEVVRMVGGG
jgi:thiamine biosynthesis protein ThiS